MNEDKIWELYYNLANKYQDRYMDDIWEEAAKEFDDLLNKITNKNSYIYSLCKTQRDAYNVWGFNSKYIPR